MRRRRPKVGSMRGWKAGFAVPSRGRPEYRHPRAERARLAAMFRHVARSALICWLFAASAPAHGQPCTPADLRRGLPTLPPLHQLAPAALDSVLVSLRSTVPGFEDRVRALALARLGAPYVLGCLGESSAEDRDPIFRVDQVDCTVLVLTTVAMAQSTGLAD